MRKILFVGSLNMVGLSSKCYTQNGMESYYRKKRNDVFFHYAAIILVLPNFFRKFSQYVILHLNFLEVISCFSIISIIIKNQNCQN